VPVWLGSFVGVSGSGMMDTGEEDVEMLDVSLGEGGGNVVQMQMQSAREKGKARAEPLLICAEVDFSGEVDVNGKRQGEEKDRQQVAIGRMKILSP
jgi:hypothetical protein